MREQTEDLNRGAILEQRPAKVQAARTVAVATQASDKAQGKAEAINKLTSSLSSAISPYLEEEAVNKNKIRFQKAYLEPGTKEGREQFLRDNKRTGISAAFFGQKPEVKGVIAASANAAAQELYVEQSAFIESDQGDMSEQDYFEHSSTVVKTFMEENFTESPEAAIAFMEQWQTHSNTLATQHSKLQALRDQQNLREGFKNEWQTALSAAKTLIPHNPEEGFASLENLYDYNQVRTNMDKPAWTSAVVEETLAVLAAGDVSVLETFRASPIFGTLDAKQRKAYTTSISKLDTDNVNRVSHINDTLEISVQSAKTQSEISRAFETHAQEIINLSARNTFTAKHMATMSGGDVFRGKLAATYDTKRKEEKAANTTTLKLEADAKSKQYDYEVSTIKGDEGDAITSRITKHTNHITSSIEMANNLDLPLEVRSKYVDQATKAQKALDAERGNLEATLSSKANLIQSQISLLMSKAEASGEQPNIPKEMTETLQRIGAMSKDDNTKTLVNNLLTGVTKANTSAGKDYVDAVNQEEVDTFQTGNNENKLGLSTIEGDSDIPEDQRDLVAVQYIENTIAAIQQQRDAEGLTKSGAKELQKQELWWKNKLTPYATEADKLARKQALATAKLQKELDLVEGIKESWKTNTSINTDANKEHLERAADEVVEAILRTPANKDMSTFDLFDTALTDKRSVLQLQYKLDNTPQAFKSPKLKAAMNAVLRRMTADITTEVPQGTIWSNENKKAVEVMQTAYSEGNGLWEQLSSEEKAKSIYLMSAIQANTDKAVVMRNLSTPSQEGSTVRPKDEYWKGIVPALDLEYANADLQSNAKFLYNYLVPKLGHDAALEHTTKLAKFAHLTTDDIDIKYGKYFPSIPVRKSTDTTEATGKTDLESVAKGFSTWTPEVKTYAITGETRVVTTGGGYELLQQLVGNTKRKDGTTIESFKEVPGFSAEVVGDTVVFHSNYGVATLTVEQLGALATDLEKGKQRHERKRKETRRKYAMGTRGLFN